MIKSQFTKENQDFDVTNRVVSSLTIDDDEQENNLRPHSMDEYVGQEKIKKNLEVFISAAKARNDALDHVLLYGPPGLGKTTLAHVIASELGAQIRVTSGPAIEKAADLASLITNLEKGGRAVYRRDTPPQPQYRRSVVSCDGRFFSRPRQRHGAYGKKHPHTFETIYAYRRNHEGRHAVKPFARSFRHVFAP